MDVFTGRLNNILYMFCHTPTGPNRHSREFWDVGLHTDIRFRWVCGGAEQVSDQPASLLRLCRNYLEHVAESISDWTREEELKREAAKAQRLGPAQRPQGARSPACRRLLWREGKQKF